MSTERWQLIEQLFEQASELSPDERAAFLDRATNGNGSIRRDVEALLAADGETNAFLEEPAIDGRLVELIEDSDDLDPEPKLPLDGRLDPYRLLRPLGEGGMSHVYLGVRDDDQFEKQVAIKIIREGPYSKELLGRFRTERQILASLDHPYIANILDGGTTPDGLPYFVMDYVEGEPIDAFCDRERLSVKERVRLFLKVCSAVQYAHRHLIVHRDLKAPNILVAADGEPKLLDFGIAKLLKPESFSVPMHLTTADLRPLTPFYASPEQIEGRHITTASDVYSLGVLLYRLLAGRLPYRFRNRTLGEIERRVLEDPPELASVAASRSIDPETEVVDEWLADADSVAEARNTQPVRLKRRLSGDLDNILLMALRKEPARRYASVEQFEKDLQRFLNGQPVLGHKDSLGYRATKFLKRNAVSSGLAAALTVILIGSLITVSIQAKKAATQRDQAQTERDRAEQVVGFLQGIFQVSDPQRGGGETITAREILDQGAERVDRELEGQPTVQATLMETIGNVYRNLGLYDPAEPLLRRSLAARQNELGTDHPAVAQSLNNLGVVLRQRGDFVGAEPLFRQALDLRRRLFGDQHADVAQSLYNLGRLERELANFAAAEGHYREAIEIYRRLDQGSAPELATALKELGILYSDIDASQSAEPQFKEALMIRQKIYGDQHLLTAEAANDLGVFLGMQGRLDEAEPLFRRTLEIRGRLLRPGHPDVAESLNNLGRLLQEQGELGQAEALYRRSITALKTAYGDDHHLVAVYTSNLAVLLQRKGDSVEAEALHREVLAIRQRIFGQEHSDVGISLKNLGALQMEEGKVTQALTQLRASVATFERTLPSDHWRTAEARSLLGQCLGLLGRTKEAEPFLTEGFEQLRRARGLEYRRTKEALERLVEFYEGSGRADEAAEYRKVLGP